MAVIFNLWKKKHFSITTIIIYIHGFKVLIQIILTDYTIMFLHLFQSYDA